MTTPRPPPIWCAPSNVLDSRPQRVAANVEARSRHGQPAAPYGPGWCRGKRYRNVHLAMLDAETNRWTRVIKEPIHAANQSEFVTPQPAGPIPIDLVQIGAVYDRQAKTINPNPRPSHRRTVQSSNRSAFIFQDSDNARDGSHVSNHVPVQQYGELEFTASDWYDDNEMGFENLQNTISFQQPYPDGNERGLLSASHQLNAGTPSQADDVLAHTDQLSIPTERTVFPDFFYTHDPSVYSKYKDDCSGGYASFSGFIRHSLEKHERHGNVTKEGISPEDFERAKTVGPPSSVPKRDKTLKRYLLVREILFGTKQHVPIPACEHGETHPVQKVRSTKRKRSFDSSIAEASGSNEIPGAPNDIDSTIPRGIPAVRVSAPSQTPERLVHNDDVEFTKLETLTKLESEFVKRHEELRRMMEQSFDRLDLMARKIPIGLRTMGNFDRYTRLYNSLQKYIGWTKEFCFKLSEFRCSNDFPKFVDSDAMPSSASFANSHSTSSGPPMSPSVYTPEDALSQDAQI